MKTPAYIQRLKHLFKRASSLLMLFQRTPAAQVLMPAELNLASSAAMMDTAKLAIATVAGLGAYDSVAGATVMTQTGGSLNVIAGQAMFATFQVSSPSPPESWKISSVAQLPSGLSLPNISGSTNAITGTTTELGSKTVTVTAYRYAAFKGEPVSKQITINVTAPEQAAIVTNPSSTTINSGQTATLTVSAVGQPTLNYQWYQGSSGNTSTPVGTNSSSFTTPTLTSTTSYWVKVTSSANATEASSTTATVTVRQPATITAHPQSTTINMGQTTTLSVTATGHAPLTYQWYQGSSGDTSTPVGTNASSFTTPTLLATTNYWVKVTNVANTTGANSDTATVTAQAPTDPGILTSSPLPTARTNVPYTTTLTAVGGRTPYTWTVLDGDFSDGLTLSTSGVLSGTSTSIGTATATVQVKDADNKTDTRVFELTISDLDIATTTLPTGVKGTAYSAPLAATGGVEPYTWTIQGGAAPAGISLTAGGTFTGIPTTAGDAALTVRVTDDSGFSVTKSLLLPISATFVKPVVNPVSFPVISVGASFSQTITALNYPKTFTITGLPKGLKATPSGVISGIPDVSGVFNVQIRATNSAGSSPLVTTKLTVKALPKNLVGTFGGIIARDVATNRNLGGQFSLTVTSTGTYTLRITGALPGTKVAQGVGVTTAATGRLSTQPPHLSTTMAGAPVSLNIDSLTGAVSGTVGTATVTGWRSAWNALTNPAEELAGYYSLGLNLSDAGDDGVISIPQGSGYATFTVGLGGTLTLVGRTADGEAITTATFLSSEADFWMFAPLYKALGTAFGALKITPDPLAEFAGNSISGSLTWFKPATVTRTYAASFGPVNLTAEGGYLAPASTGNILLGLPDAGNVQLRFTDGGLASSTTDPDMDFTYTDDNKIVLPAAVNNPGKVALTLNANTGAVSGNFTLVENGSNFTRAKVPFQGQVVRGVDGQIKAVGYFLLPQIPAGAQKPADTAILSGGVSLQQPAR